MQDPPIWEEREKNKWPVYEEYLHYKKAVVRNPDMEFLCSDHLWLVSDGGLTADLGYYGWVIASDSYILYEGKGRVPSNTSQIDSLRSESMGMLHALTVMGKILEQNHFNGTVILASDNLELIK